MPRTAGTSRQRAAAAAAASKAAAQQAQMASINRNGVNLNGDGELRPRIKVNLSSLPVESLARYCLFHGLIPPIPLTYEQAVHPTPPLTLSLTLANSPVVPVRRRESLVPERSDTAHISSLRSTSNTDGNHEGGGTAASTSGGDLAKVEQDGAAPAHPNGNGNSMQVDSAAEANEGHAQPTAESGTTSRQTESTKRKWVDPGEPDVEALRGMIAYYGGDEQLKRRLAQLAQDHWDNMAPLREGETVVNFAYAIRMRSKVLKQLHGNPAI